MRKKLALLMALSVIISQTGTIGGIQAADEETANFTQISYNYDGEDHTRYMEKLDRGLVAVKTDTGVYLSWRLLGDESSVEDIINAPSFEVFRNGEKIADVKDSTNYIDENGNVGDTYSVAVTGAEECDTVGVMDKNYLEIPLVRPESETIEYTNASGETVYDGPYTFTPADTSCGDLDGDGQYELVVKWVSAEKDVGTVSYSGTVRLAAYELTGERMWQEDISLGKNVYSSAHTLQFIVYDLNGDGKSEIICQSSLGSKDAAGRYVSKAADPVTAPDIYNLTDDENENADFRGYGIVIEGQEFLTAFNGETGEAMDTIDLPTERVDALTFGDDFGNRSNRFLADLAYLDGVHPYAVFWRGYYFGRNGRQRTSVCGVRIDENNKIVCDYNFDTLDGQPGYLPGNELYVGQGNHNLTVADVDDDGKDEIISGALCLESDDTSDLKVRWCTFLGHGDALHIGDYDPTHKGFEFFTVHESGGTVVNGVTHDYGMSVIDADTGEILFHQAGSEDTSRGLMANTGMGGYYQISGSGNYIANGNGEFVNAPAGIGNNFRIFWDGNLYDETLNHSKNVPEIYSWNGSNMETIFRADGTTTINGTKAVPCLQADLFGDWREELVLSTKDGSALRVYTTTYKTEYKLPTLMHDPVYRSGVAAQQTAYNQPPHIGFYLAEEIFKPELRGLSIASIPNKTEYIIGEQLDTEGLEVIAQYSDGTESAVTGYITTGFDPYASGHQTVTVSYGDYTAEFDVNVNTDFKIDENGLITGFLSDDDIVVLPEKIDGVVVRGFADAALAESSITELTVVSDVTEFGKDIFPQGIKIKCYFGSSIYTYAVENGIEVIAADSRNYTFNLTYSESEYDGFYMKQGKANQTRNIGHILYGVGGRSDKYGNDAGDGKSGFSVMEYEGEKVLEVGVGQFATSGRHAYMVLNDAPAYSDLTDTVFETNLYFYDKPETGRDGQETILKAEISIKNSEDTVDSVSTSKLGLQSETWYNYKLIYHKGYYYRVVSDSYGNMISLAKLSSTEIDSSMLTLEFLQESGDFGQDRNTFLLLDNTKMYTNTEISDLTVSVIDESGIPVSNASVMIGGTEYHTDSDGCVSAVVLTGLHNITVTADGFETQQVSLGVFNSSAEREVILEKKYVEVSSVEFEDSEVAVKKGYTEKVKAYALPETASDRGILYKSSDTSVVKVSNDGLVTAVGEGTAVITAISARNDNISDECIVTVYNDYESVPERIEINGDNTVYIPNSGIASEVKFTADVFDQNGVRIFPEVNWSFSGGVEYKDGTMFVSPLTAPGNVEVTAIVEFDGAKIEAKKNIELLSQINADFVIAQEDADTPLMIFQGTQVVSETIGDITYSVGKRSGNGEIYTGFEIRDTAVEGKKAVIAKAGQWTSNNRMAYMTFDNAPSAYDMDHDYVIEADLYFNDEISMVLCGNDTLTELYTITPSVLKVETGRWYTYRLVYSNGVYTQYIIDDEGAVVSVENPQISDGVIKNIKFINSSTSSSTSMYISALKYYSTESAVRDVTLYVSDENGKVINDADLTSGIMSSKIFSDGSARYTLPSGVYTFTVESGGNDMFSCLLNITSSQSEYRLTVPADEKPVIYNVSENVIEMSVTPGLYDIFAAEYDENGVLKAIEKISAEQNKVVYEVGLYPQKVFIWTGDMKPVCIWTE